MVQELVIGPGDCWSSYATGLWHRKLGHPVQYADRDLCFDPLGPGLRERNPRSSTRLRREKVHSAALRRPVTTRPRPGRVAVARHDQRMYQRHDIR